MRGRACTHACAPERARTPIIFGMEGMEGMEGPAFMRFSGSIPRLHTLEVWKVSVSSARIRAALEAVEALAREMQESADAAQQRANQMREEAKVLRRSIRAAVDAEVTRRAAVQSRWNARRAVRELHQELDGIKPTQPVVAFSTLGSDLLGSAINELVERLRVSAAPVVDRMVVCGIYALFDGDELVYVGQSVNIAARIAQHCQVRGFTSFAALEVPRERLDDVERRLIDLLLPRMNSDPATRAMRRRRERALGINE